MIELRFKLDGRKAYLQNTKYLKQLKEVFSYFHPGARFSPAYNRRDEDGNRLWDGKISFVKYNYLPVGLLIGAHKELKEAGFKCRLLSWRDRPTVELKKGFWEESEKYSYQNKACKAILASLSKGGGTVLSATGTGKTKLAAQCFSHIRGNCLFVVDQVNLLYQSQKEISLWLKETVGIIGNGKFAPQRVTVATIQTLAIATKRKEFKKWAKNVDVVFVDELHKQMSRRNFSVINQLEPESVVGLTATLQMKKKEVRWKVFGISGKVIFEFGAKEAQEQGVLSKCAIVQVRVGQPLTYAYQKKPIRKLRDLYEDLPMGPEREYMKTVVANYGVLQLVYKLVKEGLRDNNQAIVILADRIKHVRLLRRILAKFNPRAVYGAIKESERRKIIRRFESGSYDLIIASSVFTKGVNIKRISMIIDVAQRSSRNDALQKLGRGLRLHENKMGLLYFDVETYPENIKSGSNRRNSFKKAGLKVTTVEWEDNAKEIVQVGKLALVLNESISKRKRAVKIRKRTSSESAA